MALARNKGRQGEVNYRFFFLPRDCLIGYFLCIAIALTGTDEHTHACIPPPLQPTHSEFLFFYVDPYLPLVSLAFFLSRWLAIDLDTDQKKTYPNMFSYLLDQPCFACM